MIMRLLVLIGLVGLAYYLLRRYLAPGRSEPKNQDRFAPMVRCERCGLHLPKQEAVALKNDEFYCCEQHARGED